MGKLILVRHGKSLWNVENIFTGWTDIDLAPQGMEEAKRVGTLFKKNGITVDICFSSFLKRAIRTNWIILDTSGMLNKDCHYHWRLNERHYGSWQGRKKDEVKKEVGEEVFHQIHRGYGTPPPSLSSQDERHPKFDAKYRGVQTSLLPSTESLGDTRQRTVHCFFKDIVPHLIDDSTVLVTAHGNSIRALTVQIKNLDPISISELEVPTGVPHLFEFDDNLNLQYDYLLS